MGIRICKLIRCSCYSKPLIPGRWISRIRQHGLSQGPKPRKSSADLNEATRFPVDSIRKMGSGNCNKVFLLAFLPQIPFHDFTPPRKIPISLEELFDPFYPQTYGHRLPIKCSCPKIPLIQKSHLFLVPPENYVVERTGEINPRSSSHGRFMTQQA
jgi:hypothetical protein